MTIFRSIAILLTQLPVLLYVGGSRDLLFGFNQTSAGLSTLLFLFFVVPVVNLSWLIVEIRLSVKLSRDQRKAIYFLMPILPVFFFMESIAIDLYILSHARM